MTDASPPTPDAHAADAARIDQLAEALRADPSDRAADIALWRATFDLGRWFFLARGEDAAVTPFIGVLDDVPSLMVFTTPARVRDFALGNGMSDDDASRVLAVPSDGVADFCAQFEQHGVGRVIVDQGHTGFFAPVAQLPAMQRWFAANPETPPAR